MDLLLTGLLAITLGLFWFPVPRKVIYVTAGLSVAVGIYAGLLDPLAFLSLLLLFICSHLYFTKNRPLFLGIGLAILCWLLSKNWILGFYNWQAIRNLRISDESLPFSLFFSYNKAFVGIALLLFLGPLKPLRLLKDLKKNWFIPLLTIATLPLVALFFSHIHVNLKYHTVFPLWLFHNFFFVCMPEEALFRGFIQKELNEKPLLALLASSLLFGVFHAHWGATMLLLGTVAGLFYGWIWMRTERLEAPIALHLLVNICHFFFFTYPRAFYT